MRQRKPVSPAGLPPPLPHTPHNGLGALPLGGRTESQSHSFLFPVKHMDALTSLPEWPQRPGKTNRSKPLLPSHPLGGGRSGPGRRRGPRPARGSRANGLQTSLEPHKGAPGARARRAQPRGPISRPLPVAQEGLPALGAARPGTPGTSKRPAPARRRRWDRPLAPGAPARLPAGPPP